MKSWTICFLIAALSLSGLTGIQAQHGTSPKWEYAELYVFNRTSSPGELEERRFTFGKTQVTAPCWDDLAKRLRMDGKDLTELDVINQLGDRGWELVTSTISDYDGFQIKYFYFKKAKR